MNVTTRTAVSVGTELPELAPPPVTRAMLALYAGASGDHNPIHIDSDAAVAAGLDDVIAHGMLSMAFLGRLLTDWVPLARLVSFRVTFRAPTPVHARLRCTARVTAVDAPAAGTDGPRTARLALGVRIEDGPVTVRGEAVVRLDDGPGPAPVRRPDVRHPLPDS
ncbi:MaoC/PaaZ C-terminal domain-containing protein [Streptomyces shenzhenensis]|uniref:MaoC/PaaZ C-terminal domain-containing protein n=1 Tax=Streptomyces shenzhenensis TaxID=943815 RepID=UPI0033FECF22